MKKNNKGFTLVELIVVIAILGVLMAVLVPQYIQYVEKSRIGTDESMLGEIAHNMEIGAATTELDATAEYKITLAPPAATADEKTEYSYSIETDPENAKGADELLEDVEGVIPASDIEFKSKEYKDATSITIAMKNGRVVEEGKTTVAGEEAKVNGKLWSYTKPASE